MTDPLRFKVLGITAEPDSDEQRAALRDQLAEQVGGVAADYTNLVEYLTSEYDLVPKGVGKALIEGYLPEFNASS